MSDSVQLLYRVFRTTGGPYLIIEDVYMDLRRLERRVTALLRIYQGVQVVAANKGHVIHDQINQGRHRTVFKHLEELV